LPDKDDICGLAYIAVRRHHSNLRNLLGVETNLDSFDLDVLKKQIDDLVMVKPDGFISLAELRAIYSELLPQIEVVDEFVETDINILIKKICRTLKNIVRRNDLNNYFLVLSLYSALQEADKSDAANIVTPIRSKAISPNIVSEYKSKKFHTQSIISDLRESAFKEVLNTISKANIKNNRIFSITLPTGFGKTIAALASALWIRSEAEKIIGYSPRIIYSLPFLSIIDQNAAVLKEIVLYSSLNYKQVPSNILLIHHHLADFMYRMSGQDQEEEQESLDHKSSTFLIEGWNSEIIISTFVQFLESVITNRKGMLRKFNNIAGSIIILDEVQAIPPKYWTVVDSTLNYLCYRFGCWVILVTATKPGMLRESKELANWNRYQYNDRVRYIFRREQSLEDVINVILSEIKIKRSVLTVLNTIGESKEVYNLIKDKFNSIYGDSDVDEDGVRRYDNLQLIYLSSSILPKTRYNRISRIKDLTKKTVVISTQVIEAGVDIDVDSIIRDLAPLDSIVQSAGRCNRNLRDGVIGDVRVFTLRDILNDRDYCRYVYDPLLLSITESIISNLRNPVYEKRMLEEVGRYFDEVRKAKSQEPIVNHMNALNFDNIGKFKLIENYESIQVFIEENDQAKQARIEIENNRLYGRTKLIHEIKRILNNNTMNIRKPAEISVAEELPYISGTDIRYIPMNEFNIWYDQETGLNLKVDVAIERRII
jgi:CRISPR-associated endonuclease/helicase Cas3